MSTRATTTSSPTASPSTTASPSAPPTKRSRPSHDNDDKSASDQYQAMDTDGNACSKEDSWSSFCKNSKPEDREKAIAWCKKWFETTSKASYWKLMNQEAKVESLFVILNSFDGATKQDAGVALTIMEEQTDAKARTNSHRQAMITDGLDLQLAHTFDLKKFSARIDQLFEWHTNTDTQAQFAAPYFALVQSSGMGKTKLFTEYRKQCRQKEHEHEHLTRRKCITILCVDQPLENKKEYYDKDWTLNLKGSSPSEIPGMVFSSLDDSLDDLINQGEPNVKGFKNVVLLFDEAQGLMTGDDQHEKGNLVFRSVRWWLRQQRPDNVVAVFAGTTARLTNFFPPDPPKETVSRVPTKFYKNCAEGEPDKTSKLFPPFFALNTVGCLESSSSATQASNSQPEDVKLETAVSYGRPMFAYYQGEGKLGELSTMFVRRLVLSSVDYANDNHSCYSVLGTRVQMGAVTSFMMASNLVSGGYACLVDFYVQEGKTAKPTALIAYMPDPFCATLAMRLMDETTHFPACHIKGQRKDFWVGKAKDAFMLRLCHPEKGDAGEIFCALYLLFCGDLLRRKNNPDMDTFSVSLEDWFHYLKHGGVEAEADSGDSVQQPIAQKNTRSKKKQADAANKYESVKSMKVSFIQFCRNHLRSNSYCSQRLLQHSYHSGVAFYTYSNCKAIDQVASIRVEWPTEPVTVSYHPLLISVKNWASATISDVTVWTQSMTTFLDEMRKKEGSKIKAVCLLVLIGCSDPPDPQANGLSDKSLGSFPNEDVYRLVSVPKNDSFGITDAVQSLGLMSERSELYVSHSFLRAEKSIEGSLRAASALKDEAKELHVAIHQLGKENNN